MLVIASFVSVIVGATLAVMVERFPGRSTWLDSSAGILILAGFSLLGLSLPGML
jgi:hypothetical protein